MKIYLLNVITTEGSYRVVETKFAYYDQETAKEAGRLWNAAQEAEDRKNAEEHGVSYEKWGGPYRDYAYIEHVEILGEPIKQ